MTSAETWLDSRQRRSTKGLSVAGDADEPIGGIPPFGHMEATWRQLAVRLLASPNLVPPWVVGICSAIRGEGRTTNALGLAVVLAGEVFGKVLLADCDIRSPAIAGHLSVPAEPGLSDLLARRCTAERSIYSTRIPNLLVMPAGDVRSQTRIRAGDISALFATWRGLADYTLVDMPPVLAGEDVEAMLPHLDGVVLIIRPGLSPIRGVGMAVPLIGADHIAGTIVVDDGAS
jgi:Mrp family chromosome partitioning ATPase